MIHTANEFTAQHHRYLISGTTLGLHSLGAGGGNSGEAAEGERASTRRSTPAEASKASTGFAMGSSGRCALWGLGWPLLHCVPCRVR